MKQFLLFITFLLSTILNAQVTPVIINNTNNTGLNLPVRVNTPANTSNPFRLPPNSRLLANSVVSGPNFTGSNGTSTNNWWQVDLPGATGSVTGYAAAGSTFSNPICNAGYITIVGTSANVRAGAGYTNTIVKDNNVNDVKVYNGQKFYVRAIFNAPISATLNANWFQIDLPLEYSFQTAYIASQNASGGTLASYSSTTTGTGISTPQLTYSGVTANSVQLSWAMDIQPSGSTNTSFDLYKKVGSGSYILISTINNISNNYTDNFLISGTSYSYYVVARYGSCSTQSNNISFITSGGSTSTSTITAIPNNTNYGNVNGGGTYNNGAWVNLTATPNLGYTFINWTENGSFVFNNSTYQFIAATSRTLTANFQPQTGCSLSVSLVQSFFNVNCGDNFNLAVNNPQSGVSYTWTNPTGATITGINFSISNASSSDAGIYTVTATKAGCISATAKANVTLNACPTISITGTDVPAWQRNGDSFDGSVTVNTGATYKPWKLEVYKNGGITPIKIYYSNTSSPEYIKSFYSNDFGTLSKDDDISYYVAFQDNSNVKPVIKHTIITEVKWDNKNIVFQNEVGASPLKIPIQYRKSAVKFDIQFTRYNLTSNSLSAPTLTPSTRNINTTVPYVVIDQSLQSDNTLFKDKAGVIEYTIRYYDVNNVQVGNKETGNFDLTKIGKITYPNTNGWGANANRLMIIIGGIINSVEGQCQAINNFPSIQNGIDPSYLSSKYDMSIISYFNSKGYNTWYIAQGNLNGVKQNAYDIGIAIEKIYQLNPNTTDINIITHSKGGLEIKALLGTNTNVNNLTKALNGTSYNYSTSSYKNMINKVVFLATPHKGAIAANLPALTTLTAAQGIYDLTPNTGIDPNHILNLLDNVVMPSSCKFLNLTATVGGLVIGDGVVSVTSSESFTTNDINNKHFQLYQSWADHLHIHNNHQLSNNAICSYQNRQNIDYIESFLCCLGMGYNLTCTRSNTNQFTISTIKSILSNAKIEYKTTTDTSFNIVGQTDENGKISFQIFNDFNIGDSIKISATGVETQYITINNSFLSKNKLVLPMFKSPTPTTKIQYPSLSLVNQNPITANATIQIKVTAKNAASFLINQHNSDTSFVPLTLSSNTATINLDTGFNNIIVKYVGVDTLTIAKQVYYLPDTLMRDFAMDFTINCSNHFIGSKMFVNNIFYKDIATTSNTLKLLRGINEVKFSKFGYRDTLFTIDSIRTVNLSMLPYSYSSSSDSSIINFNNGLNPQYWKTITVKNTSSTSNIKTKLKQFDTAYTELAVMPQSRMFQFTNVGTTNNAKLRTAIALDQAITPNVDSVYYLTSKDGVYKKYDANITNISEYDAEVQKLAFDSISLPNANSVFTLCLMKKQAVTINETPKLEIRSDDNLKLPLSMFVTDPDNLKQDVQVTINNVSVSNTDFSFTIVDSFVYIKPNYNFTGDVVVKLSATHDFITIIKDVKLKVLPPIVEDVLTIYPNPANATATADLLLTGKENYTLYMYDLRGILVKTIFMNKQYSKGHYTEKLLLNDLPSGIYLFRLNDGKPVKFVKQPN